MGFLDKPFTPYDEKVVSDRRELGTVGGKIFGYDQDELGWEARKDDFLTKLLDKREQYYANVEGDSGGKTIWGLTTSTYGKKYIDDLEKMEPTDSKEIAREKYQEDHLAEAEELFGRSDMALKFADISINTGRSNALGILQNALNRLLPASHQLSVDRALGNETKKAIANVQALFSPAKIQNALVEAQMDYYQRQSNTEDFPGWTQGPSARAFFDPSK